MTPGLRFLRFLGFGTVFLSVAWLHFGAAIWAYRKLRNPRRAEIDTDYVRMEHFEALAVRGGAISADIRAESFSSPPGSTRPGIIHVDGDCILQKGMIARAVVAEGRIELREGAAIEDFADSRGELTIGRNCEIGGRVTSATSIILGAYISARSLLAPEIRTGGSSAPPALPGAAPLRVEISSLPSPVSALMHQMSPDTWIYRGSLHIAEPLILRSKLVVMGSFSAGPGSELLDDVKASGDLSLGAGSICHGNLVCGGNMALGEGTRFERILHAGGEIKLARSVRGEGPQPVVAYAGHRVILYEDILIRGKVASEREVVTRV
jgi:predicted acyltransferase (DUF342 family)